MAARTVGEDSSLWLRAHRRGKLADGQTEASITPKRTHLAQTHCRIAPRGLQVVVVGSGAVPDELDPHLRLADIPEAQGLAL